MTITLHVFPPSPRAVKVLAVANHLDLPYEIELVDLTKGAQKTPEFTALNPNQRIPVLVEDDYVLWESNAIMQYLALKKPTSGLLPLDEASRIDVTRWQFWDAAHWDAACAIYIFEYLVKPLIRGIPEPDAANLARGDENFHRAAKILDAQLKGRKFVTQDRLTLADFSLAAPLHLAAAAHLPLEPYAEIQRWYQDLGALPSWQKTMAQAAMPSSPEG